MGKRKTESSDTESASIDTKIQHILGYGIEAPSGHNTQPWRFKILPSKVEVYADRTRCLPVVDPYDRELAISCGAAIGFIEVAARAFCLNTTVTYLNTSQDTDLLAEVKFSQGEAATPEELTLFEVIPNRRTNRSAFRMQAVPEGVLRRCRELSDQFGTDLTIIEKKSDREDVAKLVSEGDKIQFEDPHFRRELAAWIHSTRSATHDGMSGAGFGLPDVLSPLGSLIIRTFDMGNGIAANDAQKIISASPVLFVFGSESDTSEAWLNTGRALAHVLLYLTVQGVSNSYLNQPIEIEALRSELQTTTDMAGFPQLLLRIGYTDTQPPPSVRRELGEVLVP